MKRNYDCIATILPTISNKLLQDIYCFESMTIILEHDTKNVKL